MTQLTEFDVPDSVRHFCAFGEMLYFFRIQNGLMNMPEGSREEKIIQYQKIQKGMKAWTTKD